MPVSLARPSEPTAFANLRERRIRRGVIQDRGRRLRIDLVNNMPDAAAFSTQRQFVRLLDEGARDFDVTVGLVALETIERSEETRREMRDLYRPPLLGGPAPDAFIFTGAEPRAARLEDEPYWPELTAVFNFARWSSFATLASCLAAHALVLHRDGVRRRKSVRKWSGLFVCEIATAHPLTANMSGGLTPHSRWNGLDAAELEGAGYVVLTRCGQAGVDAFAKNDGHLTLFFQGHPEYDADTLAREYRRDVMRALEGAPEPAIPENYFPPETEARLLAHVANMMNGAEAPRFPKWAMAGPEPVWRARGAILVNNWLKEISARKLATSGTKTWRARWGG